jgi:hypothetical protein
MSVFGSIKTLIVKALTNKFPFWQVWLYNFRARKTLVLPFFITKCRLQTVSQEKLLH